MADTVIKPNGGTAAFFDINFKACLKLQNDSGQTGYTNKIFIKSILNKAYCTVAINPFQHKCLVIHAHYDKLKFGIGPVQCVTVPL